MCGAGAESERVVVLIRCGGLRRYEEDLEKQGKEHAGHHTRQAEINDMQLQDVNWKFTTLA